MRMMENIFYKLSMGISTVVPPRIGDAVATVQLSGIEEGN
jgi:hypothetical protein